MLAVSGFNRETSHGIFVMDGLHTPFRCLTKSLESPCVAPLWSLTNDLLAFTAIDKGYYRRHQLYAVDVSNDAMEPISDSLPYIYGLSWLPDAQHLALFEMEDDA